MKKLFLSGIAIASLFAMNNNSDINAKIKKLENEIQSLKQELQNTTQKVNPIAANDHIYWNIDFRSSIDIINYKLTNGDKKNNNVLSNRLILTGIAKPSDNLKFNLRIEANNIYGMNNNPNIAYDNSNATANETPDDTNIRVREAYFNYWWADGMMFSAGRRPALEGYPANFREGDDPESPLAHLTNMEFDGISINFFNDAIANWNETLGDLGMWFKICAGRGFSPNEGKFGTNTPYAKNDKINDFAGFIFVPYDNGQYSVKTQFIKAWNVRGYIDTNGDGTPDTMKALGGYVAGNIVFAASGIGDGISDFLDDTNAFISFAMSKTLPNSYGELGTTDSKTGSSIWIGADMPAGDNGRFGFNFVHGSKYFRNMTYGEDTLIGSIASTRGNAYEVYYIRDIIPHLSFSLRATLIRYNYTGSNAFFGDFGAPQKVDDNPNAVKRASDIRAYIRYKF